MRNPSLDSYRSPLPIEVEVAGFDRGGANDPAYTLKLAVCVPTNIPCNGVRCPPIYFSLEESWGLRRRCLSAVFVWPTAVPAPSGGKLGRWRERVEKIEKIAKQFLDPPDQSSRMA
jgi:hypothetical protein